jgi:hypothetical protein
MRDFCRQLRPTCFSQRETSSVRKVLKKRGSIELEFERTSNKMSGVEPPGKTGR